MKRLFLLGFLGLAAAPALFAQTPPYTVTGTQFFATPGTPPPVIDNRSFVVNNGATLGIDLTTLNEISTISLGDLQSPVFFTTWDTLNYTNKGNLMCIPGFDFEYFQSDPPLPQPGVPFSTMAGTFANIASSPAGGGPAGGNIFCTNIFGGASQFSPLAGPNPLALPGLATLKVNATNIIDSGLVSMDNTGLIDFRGQNLDLRRGNFSLQGGLGVAGYLILDWGSGGFGTNTTSWSPDTQLSPTTASSPAFFSTSGNFFNFEQMILTNSKSYFQSLNPGGLNPPAGANVVWRAVFIQDSSPSNVTNHVYFNNSFFIGNGEFTIEWVGTYPDPVTGALNTNYLYLNDVPVNRRSTNFSFGLPPDTQSQAFGEFTITESAVRQPLGFPTPQSFTFPPTSTNDIVTNDFGYISAEPSTFVVTNEVFGGSVTNVPGRIQLSSSQTMQLANTRISTPNYLLLSAPVDFRGNSNSVISSAFADLNLGVTGQSFTISNLLNPRIPEWTGVTNAPSAIYPPSGFIPPIITSPPSQPMSGLQVWSGSYLITQSNLTGGIFTNDVRIVLINSAVSPVGPTEQQDVKLHTGNDLVISDELDIFRSFSSDAQTLTLTTNGHGAFSLSGVLNLLSSDIFWSSSLTNLQFLTNWGAIDTQNQTFFAGNMFSPESDFNLATPYQAFINHGIITNQGTFIRTGVFENSGVIADEPGGSVDIAASSGAVATNGQFLAPGGYVSISADSLIASNGIIDAGGGPLTLNIGCSLSDGYIFGNQFAEPTNSMFPHVVTNGNIWITAGGISIPSMPQTGTADLLGTTITNLALQPNFVSPNIWPAADRGVDQNGVPQGFGDDLAVGRMIFNADSTSQFDFMPAAGNNAVYIDRIEFQGNTTNTDGNGNPLSIAIQPGMNIYYAEAVENGVSIAEKLNGKFGGANTNGGHFFWVSNYAGVYSSTNILYPDGNKYIFNHALAISPDINSGGPDGTQVTNTFLVNSQNPFPIPTNIFYPISISGPLPCAPVGGLNAGGPGTNSSGSIRKILGQLTLPPETPASVGGHSNTPVVFSLAAGSYNGLFYDTNTVRPSSSGYFSATVTPKGGFSAKLQLGSQAYSFSGAFDNSGAAAVNVSGKGLPTLSVNLQLVGNDSIIGSVSGGSWLAQLQADRAAFSSKIGTASAGKETLLLQTDDQIATTATGEGFGTANISTSGGVQWTATLPDGVKITQKTALSKTGVWPVYASLYGGNGVFIGWMQCTNQIDVLGSAIWEMPAGAGGLYSGGLTNQMDVSGSRLRGSIPASAHYAAVLSGAGLESSVTNQVGVFGKNVMSANSALKFSVNPQTGLFNGSLTLPNSNQKLSFQGALLEKSGVGGGFFLNADQSGKVYFGPAN
jgi:hypothetical protein